VKLSVDYSVVNDKTSFVVVDEETKMKKSLLGGQFFVIFVVFLIAEITTFDHIPTNFGNRPEILIPILV
jgi:hypothetical protein